MERNVKLVKVLQRLTSNQRVMGYAGRWRFGERCVATIFPETTNLFKVVTEIALLAAGDDVFTDLELEELMEAAHVDNFGNGWVLYWPNLTWPEGLESEDN